VSRRLDEPENELESKARGRRSQRACWALLKRVHTTLDLSFADIVEVQAIDAGAHIALLARQFPGLHFELAQEATRCQQSIRVLWAPDGVSDAQTTRHLSSFDAVIVTHAAHELSDVLRIFDGFARVAGVRDCGDGRALAIFGKGLTRDLFRLRVRDPLAA
jgi:hypothetical protein